jgi:hypothetical protein
MGLEAFFPCGRCCSRQKRTEILVNKGEMTNHGGLLLSPKDRGDFVGQIYAGSEA